MTIAEAIREYVNETEGLEFYEQEPEKGLGIMVKGDNSYMETVSYTHLKLLRVRIRWIWMSQWNG